MLDEKGRLISALFCLIKERVLLSFYRSYGDTMIEIEGWFKVNHLTVSRAVKSVNMLD